MTTDFTFQIGSSHEVCQDYAAAGLLETGEEYVVLSDGCSGAQHSDWGARILCRFAPRWIEGDRFRGVEKAWRLDSALRVLGLEDSCLLATLLIAKKDASKIRVWAHGDGAVVGITHSGGIHARIIQYSYSESQGGTFPGYLAYHLGDGVREHYLADCNNGARTVTDQNGKSEPRTGIDEPDVFDFPIREYKAVLLLSDGVESVRDGSGDRVGPFEVIQYLTSNAHAKESFVRGSASVRLSLMKSLGWTHRDDLSIAWITV